MSVLRTSGHARWKLGAGTPMSCCRRVCVYTAYLMSARAQKERREATFRQCWLTWVVVVRLNHKRPVPLIAWQQHHSCQHQTLAEHTPEARFVLPPCFCISRRYETTMLCCVILPNMRSPAAGGMTIPCRPGRTIPDVSPAYRARPHLASA
eukprot:1604138-Rhodomonas_salina.3